MVMPHYDGRSTEYLARVSSDTCNATGPRTSPDHAHRPVPHPLPLRHLLSSGPPPHHHRCRQLCPAPAPSLLTVLALSLRHGRSPAPHPPHHRRRHRHLPQPPPHTPSSKSSTRHSPPPRDTAIGLPVSPFFALRTPFPIPSALRGPHTPIFALGMSGTHPPPHFEAESLDIQATQGSRKNLLMFCTHPQIGASYLCPPHVASGMFCTHLQIGASYL